MPFEIRNKNGKRLSIESLNQEVSEFWGMPIVQYTEHGETYMTVFPPRSTEEEGLYSYSNNMKKLLIKLFIIFLLYKALEFVMENL